MLQARALPIFHYYYYNCGKLAKMRTMRTLPMATANDDDDQCLLCASGIGP